MQISTQDVDDIRFALKMRYLWKMGVVDNDYEIIFAIKSENVSGYLLPSAVRNWMRYQRFTLSGLK